MEEVKYSSYTEAQKRATKKYRENNKERVNAQRKKYYEERKNRDPNFLLYKRQKAKEYYDKKKALRAQLIDMMDKMRLKSKDAEKIEEIKEEVKEEVKDNGLYNIIEDIVNTQPPEIEPENKKKRKRKN